MSERALVSVVIPCYNSAGVIEETVRSVLLQDYPFIEIRIIDDGSGDKTPEIIQSIQDDRLNYIFQKNAGVSAARNKGLLLAKGKYIIFFDSDDKMTPGFISSRIAALESDPGAQFSCGKINRFPGNHRELYGAVQDIPKEILHYLPQFATCPSNYLIKRALLIDNNISFNESLSSTADRFFLLELDKVARGALVTDAPLLYRISPLSMSNKITSGLMEDNERFLNEVLNHDLVPRDLYRYFTFSMYYILGFGFMRTGNIKKGSRFIFMAFLAAPHLFLKRIIKKIFR